MALYIPHSIFHLARLLYVRPETSGPYYVQVKLFYTIIRTLTLPSVFWCTGFHVARMQSKFCQSFPHHTKCWAGLLYSVNDPCTSSLCESAKSSSSSSSLSNLIFFLFEICNDDMRGWMTGWWQIIELKHVKESARHLIESVSPHG